MFPTKVFWTKTPVRRTTNDMSSIQFSNLGYFICEILFCINCGGFYHTNLFFLKTSKDVLLSKANFAASLDRNKRSNQLRSCFVNNTNNDGLAFLMSLWIWCIKGYSISNFLNWNWLFSEECFDWIFANSSFFSFKCIRIS